MNMLKRITCLMLAALMIVTVCACTKKSGSDVCFTDLQLGQSKASIEEMLGTDYEILGSDTERMSYEGLRLFDFLGKGENTKLTVFLNTESNAYCYAFYMYDALDGNYQKVKEHFEALYGAATEGENSSEQWTDGDVTYSLYNQSEYVAIAKF